MRVRTEHRLNPRSTPSNDLTLILLTDKPNDRALRCSVLAPMNHAVNPPLATWLHSFAGPASRRCSGQLPLMSPSPIFIRPVAKSCLARRASSVGEPGRNGILRGTTAAVGHVH